MPDRIEVRGIRGHGFHGVLDFERREGQEFRVDVAFTVDAAPAAAADDLALTVDYGAVAELVHARIVGPAFDLIETLAHRIADDIAAIEGVGAVTVAVHKPQAPIPVPFDDVSITVERRG